MSGREDMAALRNSVAALGESTQTLAEEIRALHEERLATPAVYWEHGRLLVSVAGPLKALPKIYFTIKCPVACNCRCRQIEIT